MKQPPIYTRVRYEDPTGQYQIIVRGPTYTDLKSPSAALARIQRLHPDAVEHEASKKSFDP